MMKTYQPKAGEVERKWYLMDAEGQILGRMASRIASILRGKEKTIYSPHVSTGDFVIVINAEKIKVTGGKEKKKIYDHYTGYPDGLRQYTYEKLAIKKPEEIITRAVKNMLPNTRLAARMMTHLRVFKGAAHDLQAQKPETLKI